MTDTYQPELGQMLHGYHNGFPTPEHVGTGIVSIDQMISEHIYGVREVRNEYGTYASFDMHATSNSGWIHDLQGAPFSMRAYCWCDGERPGHEEGCPPNFHHFETDFQAYWYKHSNRGQTCNQKISSSDWMKIQRECEDWVLAQPPAYRVLITGSREWAADLYEPVPRKKYKRIREDWYEQLHPDTQTMRGALLGARKAANGAHMRIVEGGAQGADQLAGLLTSRASNASVEVHPAIWDRKSDGSYNKMAGFQRNQQMIDAGADICLAFFKTGAANRGTKDCVDRAKRAGIEVVETWG